MFFFFNVKSYVKWQLSLNHKLEVRITSSFI